MRRLVLRPARLIPLAGLLLTALLAAGLSWYYIRAKAELEPVEPGDQRPVLVEVKPGANTAVIAGELKQRGLIRDSFVFRLYARHLKLDGRLRSGVYEFSPSMSVEIMLNKLSRGEVATNGFTIPEGFTVLQVADHLAERGLADRGRFLRAARSPSFRPRYLPPGAEVREPLEGYLFPDTYKIPKGLPEEGIIQLMRDRWEEVLAPGLRARANDLKLSIHELITLASIVEKEATAKDRDRVAAVFHNRLGIGMKLDSCATINYVLDIQRAVLTLDDLETPSPYNTYRNPGLPPGPIANPGEAAIKAALYPAPVNYLYFVVKGPGEHAFAATHDQHLANRALYDSDLGPGSQP